MNLWVQASLQGPIAGQGKGTMVCHMGAIAMTQPDSSPSTLCLALLKRQFLDAAFKAVREPRVQVSIELSRRAG